MKINCKQLMQEIGYSNTAQATKILGEPKAYITEAEARAILDKIGATKLTASNKERVLNAQTILGTKKYLEYTRVDEDKKVTKAVAKKEPAKRTESEEIEKYKETVKKLLAEKKALETECNELKAENILLKMELKFIDN